MSFQPETYDEPSIRVTPRKTALRGVFQLSRAAVPYFLVNVSLEDLDKGELKLVEELPADYRQRWRLEELFQRDIDWERVQHDIVTGYLRRRDKRTFFNALTVALLPIDAHGRLDDTYRDPEGGDLPPKEGPFGDAQYDTKNIGGIQIASMKGRASDVVYLRWNERTVFPATIDGQHRLAALKTFLNNSQLTKEQWNTKVPVIFLILDDRVGFRIPQSEEFDDVNPLLSLVREVFIDLNKHAREVSLARQVLLDDQELEARCVRSLLAARVGEDSETELPLGLVNWKDDVAKFDTGPYMSSVYVLYLLVKEILNLAYPKDPLDESQVRKFVSSLEDRFRLSSRLQRGDGKRVKDYQDRPPLMQFVQENYLDDDPKPFQTVPYAYGSAVVDSFDEIYKPLIVGLFGGFRQYSEFRNLSSELGGIDGDLAFFNGQSERLQKQLRDDEWDDEEYDEKVGQPRLKLEEFKRGKWPFMVVFQKGLIKATVDAFAQSAVTLGDGVDRHQFLTEWVAFLDRLDEQGLFSLESKVEALGSSDYWEGICKAPISQNIKYTNSATGRIRDQLILLWYLDNSGMEATPFFEALKSKSSNEEFPDGQRSAGRVINALKSVVRAREAAELEGIVDQDLDKELFARASDRLVTMLEASSSKGS